MEGKSFKKKKKQKQRKKQKQTKLGIANEFVSCICYEDTRNLLNIPRKSNMNDIYLLKPSVPQIVNKMRTTGYIFYIICSWISK